jgi:predicted porin
MFLQSDSLAGFRANAFYTQNNSASVQTTPAAAGAAAGSYSGGNSNAQGWGLGADYTWNKLYVTGAYQSFKAENPYGAVSYSATSASGGVSSQSASAGGAVAWGVGGASAAGTNTKDVNGYVAATYDFGILKAYAQYLNRKVTSVIDGNQYLSRSAQQLGVRSYITPTVEAFASAGNGRIQAFGTAQPTANFTGYQLGSNYYLSKRTNLYAIYGATNTSNVYTATTGTISSNYSQYAVGVRHTF